MIGTRSDWRFGISTNDTWQLKLWLLLVVVVVAVVVIYLWGWRSKAAAHEQAFLSWKSHHYNFLLLYFLLASWTG